MIPENFWPFAIARFAPTLVVDLIQLTRTWNVVEMKFWRFYYLTILLSSTFNQMQQ